jgi:hypothetical protein
MPSQQQLTWRRAGVAPQLPTNRGYKVKRSKPQSNKHSAELMSPSGKKFNLFMTDLELSFSVGGNYAQAHRFRAWYPRSFAQPTVTVSGQSDSQEYYGDLAEFVRICQKDSLRFGIPTRNPGSALKRSHTRLMVWKTHRKNVNPRTHSNYHRLEHDGYLLYGHIKNIQRRHAKGEFWPEWQFELVLVAAENSWLHDLDLANARAELAHYMRMELWPNHRNTEWFKDPDKKGAAGYTKGPGRPD